jgi:hypothetical protein
MDEAHIHPLDAHYWLALLATNVLIETHINPAFHGHNSVAASLPSYFELRWGRQLNLVHFREIMIDLYSYLIGCK